MNEKLYTLKCLLFITYTVFLHLFLRLKHLSGVPIADSI